MIILQAWEHTGRIIWKGFIAFPVEKKQRKPEIVKSKQNLFSSCLGMNKN